MISRTFLACTAAVLLALAIPGATALATGAANDHTVLILAATVTGGMTSPVAVQAMSLGYTVELATDAQWLAKSTADFSTYRALIFGDPDCGLGSVPLAAAEASINVWGPAVDGNIVINGSDPAFHTQWFPANATAVIRSMVTYAAGTPPSANKTGMYMSLSCYFNETGPNNAVLVLNYFGTFVVADNPSCWDAVHITAPPTGVLAGVTDAMLSNWNCSIHELFTTYPANFTPAAIADGLNSVYTAPDGHVGTPYILFRDAPNPCPLPPTITINSVTPITLWPPNKQMINCVVNATVTGSSVNVTRTVTCSETPTGPTLPLCENGSDVYHFKLRAGRNGAKTARVYTVTYTATDACGNVVISSFVITVPHDQRGNNNGNDEDDSDHGNNGRGNGR